MLSLFTPKISRSNVHNAVDTYRFAYSENKFHDSLLLFEKEIKVFAKLQAENKQIFTADEYSNSGSEDITNHITKQIGSLLIFMTQVSPMTRPNIAEILYLLFQLHLDAIYGTMKVKVSEALNNRGQLHGAMKNSDWMNDVRTLVGRTAINALI